MKSDLRHLDPNQGSEEQTFTGQFEGNVPSRLECVERTINRLKEAHVGSTGLTSTPNKAASR